MDSVDTALQIAIAVIACVVGCYAPIRYYRWLLSTVHVRTLDEYLLDKYRYPGTDWSKLCGADRYTMALYGVIATVVGILIGGVAPYYLRTRGWWTVVLIVIGGGSFFSLGVASLLACKWNDPGFLLGTLGFAGTMHYVVVAHRATVGPNPVALKISVLLVLGVAVFFIVKSYYIFGFLRSLHWRGWYEQYSQASSLESVNIGAKVTGWVGAILTLLEFINIIFGLWEKLAR